MSNNPGIVSLGGYAYQIKIFISLLPYIQENDTVEFETLREVFNEASLLKFTSTNKPKNP